MVSIVWMGWGNEVKRNKWLIKQAALYGPVMEEGYITQGEWLTQSSVAKIPFDQRRRKKAMKTWSLSDPENPEHQR